MLDLSRNRETFSKPRGNHMRIKPSQNKSQLILFYYSLYSYVFYISDLQEVKVLHLDRTRFRIRSIGWVYRGHICFFWALFSFLCWCEWMTAFFCLLLLYTRNVWYVYSGLFKGLVVCGTVVRFVFTKQWQVYKKAVASVSDWNSTYALS